MSTSSTVPLRLRLPATSANLGPGFDALGLAMTLHLTVEARSADKFAISAGGRDQEACGSLSNNLLLMTYSEVLGSLGLAAPPLSLRITNEIPHGVGCGSSAAALVAGVALASHFGELNWTKQQILDEATRREGHPDNVAACLFGGMTVAQVDGSRTYAASFGQELDWRLLLALPGIPLSTAKARSVLPDAYSRADAVHNVQAASLLVAAFHQGRPELLRIAMQDRLHQPYRKPLCPLFARLSALAGTAGVLGLALSGAGPAVLLIVDETFPRAFVEDAGANDLSEVLELRIAGPASVW